MLSIKVSFREYEKFKEYCLKKIYILHDSINFKMYVHKIM